MPTRNLRVGRAASALVACGLWPVVGPLRKFYFTCYFGSQYCPAEMLAVAERDEKRPSAGALLTSFLVKLKQQSYALCPVFWIRRAPLSDRAAFTANVY